MKILLTNLLLLLSTITLYSQSYSSEEFSVSPNDLNINTYIKDSTVNALVIYEYGKSYIDENDFLLKTEYQKKVKILNRNGFHHATIEIPLYKTKSSKETITDITAKTFNSRGGAISSTRLDKSDIFYEDITTNHTIVKFTLPNIQEGSVIVFSYKLSSPFIYKYHEWIFQEDIPKLYSEYNVSIPGTYNYNIKLVGPFKFYSSTSKIEGPCLKGPGGSFADCGITKYIIKDLPAFIEEDYMTSNRNYLSRLDFELKTIKHFDGRVDQITKTWEIVDQELKSDRDIGGQIRKSIKSKDYLSSEIINETDNIKKAKAIYNYVQDEYKWNGDYKIFSDTSVKDLIKNKSGNVSSINILLNNLLNDCDIDAKPVLLSTRNNGFPTKIYPVMSDFNYLIVHVKIGNETFFLDAAEANLPFGTLSFSCLNGYGRIIDFKNGSAWIDIDLPKPSNLVYRIEMDIKDDSLNISAGAIKTGYFSLASKQDFNSDSDKYKKNFQDKYPIYTISNHTVEDTNRNAPIFKETLNMQMGLDPMEKTDLGETKKVYYINPILFGLYENNPFQLKERSYPIDFGYKSKFTYMLKLNTKGFKVEEVPENKTYTLPNNSGTLVFNVNQEADFLTINLKFSLNKAIYGSQYYPTLKEIASELINIQKNSIIILNSI